MRARVPRGILSFDNEPDLESKIADNKLMLPTVNCANSCFYWPKTRNKTYIYSAFFARLLQQDMSAAADSPATYPVENAACKLYPPTGPATSRISPQTYKPSTHFDCIV